MAFLTKYRELPKCHISKFIFFKSETPYLIKGIIDNEPQLKNNRPWFVFRTESIQIGNENLNCCGRVIVYLKSKQKFSYGEELILGGNVYKPFSNHGQNRKSYRDYLYNQGIFFIMNVRNDAHVVRLNKSRGSVITRLALKLKNTIEARIRRRTTFLSAAILDAMILGEKKDIPWTVNNAMMKTGTVHILVVSGFNVGIVTFIISLLLKLIGLKRRTRFILGAPLLILYCLITGASNPVIRATIMAISFMFAYFVKRDANIFNSLSIAAIFILVCNPNQLFDIGFQLSFASVISIAWLYPRIKSLLRIGLLNMKYIGFLVDGLLVSLSAWIGTMGFIAYYFKLLSPVTVLANIFIVPLATLITLSGSSLIIIDFIYPPLALPFALVSESLVIILLKVNTILLQLPLAYFYL